VSERADLDAASSSVRRGRIPRAVCERGSRDEGPSAAGARTQYPAGGTIAGCLQSSRWPAGSYEESAMSQRAPDPRPLVVRRRKAQPKSASRSCGGAETPVASPCIARPHPRHQEIAGAPGRGLFVNSDPGPATRTGWGGAPWLACDRRPCRRRPDFVVWPEVSGSKSRLQSFQDSYHGLKSKAGDATFANCASCHAHLRRRKKRKKH